MAQIESSKYFIDSSTSTPPPFIRDSDMYLQLQAFFYGGNKALARKKLKLCRKDPLIQSNFSSAKSHSQKFAIFFSLARV